MATHLRESVVVVIRPFLASIRVSTNPCFEKQGAQGIGGEHFATWLASRRMNVSPTFDPRTCGFHDRQAPTGLMRLREIRKDGRWV